MTEIVFAEVDGERLSREEVVANGVFFLAAGHETTAIFSVISFTKFVRYRVCLKVCNPTEPY